MAAIEWGAVLRWYLAIQILGIPFVYLGRRLFGALPDQGYVIAKALAILLVGLGSWLAFAWLQLPFGKALPWGVWLVIGGLIWMWRRTELGHWHRLGLRWTPGPPRAVIWTAELVFGLVLVGWVWVVAHDPGIEHTEQPMDFMFMNSLWATTRFPPEDAWLAGFPVSYYYFGYWMLVCVAKAANVHPGIAYNLGQATWYALLWLGAFGIGYNVFAAWHRQDRETQPPSGHGAALATGLLSSLCVACMGNLQGLFEWLYAQGLGKDQWYARLQVRHFPESAVQTGQWFVTDHGWWWWRSARVISDQTPAGHHLEVIAEMPMFSYILGDNHPHVLFAPFLFVAMYLGLQQFMTTGREDKTPAALRPDARGPTGPQATWAGIAPQHLRLGLAMVLTGAAYLANSWDLVAVLLLLPLSLSLASYPLQLGRWVRRLLVKTLLVVGGAAILALPYLLTFQSQVQGIQINWFNPTRPSQLLVLWGPVLMACGVFLTLHAHRRLQSVPSAGIAVVAVWLVPGALMLAMWGIGHTSDLLASLPATEGITGSTLLWERWGPRWLTPALLGLLVGLGAAQAVNWGRGHLAQGDSPAVQGFAVLCVTLGLILVYVPEFVFLQDHFGPQMRMNTVFKFHYQAWHLLAPVMALAIMLGLRRPRRGYAVGASACLALLFLAGMVYPVAGIGTKMRSLTDVRTLDVYRRLGTVDPAAAEALDWLRTRTQAREVIAEAPGHSYRADTSRVSAFTGLVTLLGWTGHESQWRGAAYPRMTAGREEALAVLYETGTREEILQIMETWDIAYIYLGPAERQQYAISDARVEWLSAVLRPVYDKPDILILARPLFQTSP